MKQILYLILIVSILPITIAQDFEKYDQYDCIIEKLLEDCNDKEIYIADGGWEQVTDLSRKSGFLKQHIIKREQEVLDSQEGTMTTTTHFLIYCKYPSEEFSPKKVNTLGYLNDHFLWERHTIDCAWIRNKYDVDIGDVILTGNCPTFVIGSNNQISKDCRDTKILSTEKFVLFSLGGLTIFGLGIHYVVNLFKKSKKGKSKAL